MGFWHRIFGNNNIQKENSDKEEITIGSGNDLLKFLEKKHESHSKLLLNDFRPKYNEIQNAVGSLDANLTNLQAAQNSQEMDNEEINQRILMNADAARKRFVERMRFLVGKMREPTGSDFNLILKFCDSCAQLLKDINAGTSRDYLNFKDVFQKEASSVYSDFKKIDLLIRTLSKTVDRKKASIDAIEKCGEDLEKMMRVKNSIEAKDRENENLGQKMKVLEEDSLKLENNISNLNNSKEMEELNSLSKERENIKAEMSQKSSQVLQNVSILERAVRKFRKLVDDGITDFQNKKFLYHFLDNPVETVLRHDIGEFYTMLRSVEKEIAGHKIDLGDRFIKTLNTLKSLSKTDLIDRLVGDLKNLEEKGKNLDKKISESRIKDEIQKAKLDLQSVKDNIDDSKTELTGNESLIEKLKSDMTENRKRLEERLKSVSGENIRLAF